LNKEKYLEGVCLILKDAYESVFEKESCLERRLKEKNV
jgi:hypothetical protein